MQNARNRTDIKKRKLGRPRAYPALWECKLNAYVDIPKKKHTYNAVKGWQHHIMASTKKVFEFGENETCWVLKRIK